MKIISILFATLLLTSCGIIKKEKKSVNIHPDLQAFAKQFEAMGNLRIDNLNMTFGEIDGRGGVLGFCQMGVKEVFVKGGLQKDIYNIRNIVVDQQDWNYWIANGGIERANKELLAFHEMGHCVLNRDHTEQSAKSIMRPYHMGGNAYVAEYDTLIAELFNKPKSYYANVSFNGSAYASKAMPEEESLIGKTEFVEPEINIPHPSEIQGGCVHKLEPEVIHEDSDEHEETETEQAE